jgi:hypothetical protein
MNPSFAQPLPYGHRVAPHRLLTRATDNNARPLVGDGGSLPYGQLFLARDREGATALRRMGRPVPVLDGSPA